VEINGRTKFCGIIGYPIEHTLSPAFQNAAFKETGLNWVYLPLEIEPHRLAEALAGLAAAGCRGLNVTMPHKGRAFSLVDETDEFARMVQAVNTIEFRDGRLIGHNTDGPGFLRSLKEEAGFDPAGRRGLIIGAGGAAQSIALALAGAGISEIKILNRTVDKAEKIRGLVGEYFPACGVSIGAAGPAVDVADFELVVNATSLGMDSNPGQPLSPEFLRAGQVVYDIIYAPPETDFLRSAKKRGARTVNGASMLLYQGAAAFTVWTGLPAPLSVMTAKLESELRDQRNEEPSATNEQSAGKNNLGGSARNERAVDRSQGGGER
jgi:shikimate dehydrogenase